MIQLRWYQSEAKEAVYNWLRQRDDNPCVVIPTAGGKTPLIAAICKDAVELWNGRVLVLAHVKELLEQSAKTLAEYCPELDFGVYSAGLKRRDKDNPVIVAGIQSIYKRAVELESFDIILVDEAHLIPTEGEGMYRTFLKDMKVINPQVRLIGLTATPYRLRSGPLCGKDELLNGVCFEVSVKRLMEEKFLCNMIGKAGVAKVDTSKIQKMAGEFMAYEMEQAFNTDTVVESACKEIASYTLDRRGVLIFSAGVLHGENIRHVLSRVTQERVEFVCGETPDLERMWIINGFKAQEFRYLVNPNLLTTGFDAPHVDCVCLLRATLSPGLYYQMLGRGFRIAPGKTNGCLALDYGENIVRHGPVDNIKVREKIKNYDTSPGEAPCKECPACHSVIAANCMQCPDCLHVFPPNHQAKADDASPISQAPTVTDTWVDVKDVFYSVHKKKGSKPEDPRTLRVDYECGLAILSEWVCLEHDGFPGGKARAWWVSRSVTGTGMPSTIEEAVALANAGGLAFPLKILVRETSGDRWPRVVDAELQWPEVWEEEPQPATQAAVMTDDDIPF